MADEESRMSRGTALDIIKRQWFILQHIPRAPQFITVTHLLTKLRDESYVKADHPMIDDDTDIATRMIQRDLKRLEKCEIFNLVRKDNFQAETEWSFKKGSQLSIPGLTPTEALVFTLAKTNLSPLLPASVLNDLEPYFSMAGGVLAGYSGTLKNADWLDKVRIIPVGQALLPPSNEEVAPETLKTIYEALLQNDKIKIEYRKYNEKSYTTYDDISPLGIVQYGILYLVCMTGNDGPIRFPLHRIRNAKESWEKAFRPKDFSLDKYIADGAFGVRKGDVIDLKAIFYNKAGNHLLETKLASEQVVKAGPEADSFEISAPVIWTLQLEWWLQGFADNVQVIEPIDLRNQLRTKLERAAGRYNG